MEVFCNECGMPYRNGVFCFSKCGGIFCKHCQKNNEKCKKCDQESCSFISLDQVRERLDYFQDPTSLLQKTLSINEFQRYHFNKICANFKKIFKKLIQYKEQNNQLKQAFAKEKKHNEELRKKLDHLSNQLNYYKNRCGISPQNNLINKSDNNNFIPYQTAKLNAPSSHQFPSVKRPKDDTTNHSFQTRNMNFEAPHIPSRGLYESVKTSLNGSEQNVLFTPNSCNKKYGSNISGGSKNSPYAIVTPLNSTNPLSSVYLSNKYSNTPGVQSNQSSENNFIHTNSNRNFDIRNFANLSLMRSKF